MLLGSSGCHPLTPFVIGNQRHNDKDNGENAQEKLHDIQRIAWIGRMKRSELVA
jgi:hypothetical protein